MHQSNDEGKDRANAAEPYDAGLEPGLGDRLSVGTGLPSARGGHGWGEGISHGLVSVVVPMK